MSDDTPRHANGAIDGLIERFEGPLVRYAARLTGGDLETARDLAQETFLELCRQDLAQLDGHLAAWIFRVCRNRALDSLKKQKRMKTMSGATFDMAQATDSDPGRPMEVREAARLARDALSTLPRKQQEVIWLKVQGGLSYREISEITGHSVSNVGYLLHVGLAALRRQLGNDASILHE